MSDPSVDNLILPPTGPFKRINAIVPKNEFGIGCRHDFHWFFEGQTKTKIKNVDEICKWLAKCKYVSDKELFMEDDFWQHPVTFEVTRQGDCDDHALWAWRKLTDLGFLAEFVAGKFRAQDEEQRRKIVRGIRSGHVWVIFKKNEEADWRLLEATEKNPKKMIITANQANKVYLPEVSIDNNFQTYRFIKL